MHTVLTGHLPPVNKSDGEPPSERDTPCVGSVISKVRAPQNGLPASVTMPWLGYHPSAPGGVAPGQHGGWLGRAFDPLLVGGDPGKPDWSVPALSLLDGLSSPRLLERQHLLTDIEAQRRGLERAAAAARLSVQQERAFGLLASPAVRTAFDLHAEPDDVRDRYGRNTHGQCVLLARRLIEAGIGWGSLPLHSIAQQLNDGALVRIRPAEWGGPNGSTALPMYIAHRRSARLGPAATWLINYIAERTAVGA